MFVACCLSALALATPGEVISQIPAPGGNPDGLTWVDGYLWITSDTDYVFYKIDPATGAVVDQMTPPGPGSGALTGLTWDGTNLWSTNPNNNTVYKLDAATGTVLDYFQPYSPAGCTGLTYDGFNIYISMQNTPLMYVHLPMVPQRVTYLPASLRDPAGYGMGRHLRVAHRVRGNRRAGLPARPRNPAPCPRHLGHGQVGFHGIEDIFPTQEV